MTFEYKNNLIHCDLSDSNLLFHIDGDKLFVGVFNWGLASNITYPPDSAYEKDNEHAVRKMKAQKIWIDLNIPKHSLQTNTFAVGKLALLIMGEYDYEYLGIHEKHHFSFFRAGMSNLCSNTLENRVSVQSKVDTIKSVMPELDAYSIAYFHPPLKEVTPL
jgi:hypothetical protein